MSPKFDTFYLIVMFVFLRLSLVNLKKVVLVSVVSLVYKNVICDRVFSKFSLFEECKEEFPGCTPE
jgi:hypothetical protein